MHELRTIYDNGGVGYSGDYIEEQKEIIEVFKKACKDIVSTSQNNKEEMLKNPYYENRDQVFDDLLEFLRVRKEYLDQAWEL